MTIGKAGSGSVRGEDFNEVVDAILDGLTLEVTAAEIDSQAAQDGDVLTADGAGGAAWVAGGGSAVTDQAVYTAEADDVPTNTQRFLSWSGIGPATGLTDLLDIVSVPAAPTVITAGVYCFNADIESFSGSSPGDFARLMLSLDPASAFANDLEAGAIFPLDEQAGMTLSPTWKLPAGAQVKLSVKHWAADPMTFAGEIYIQQLA